ncbi:fasciclin-like arabinogalactan protein 12 [Macadamia integrifolia]|uniref:fasciclin-like arabinogalactan protein 12 n=1 Tax=Macadamia integrifolia TaxID=60698 RepID=UPI001C528BE6|nr:fasciclin-like arabinogalactan protein 12 [Macadamia integrifolia]
MDPYHSHFHKTLSSLSNPTSLLFHLLLLPLIHFLQGRPQSPNSIKTEPKKTMNMKKQLLLLRIFTLLFTTTLAQSPTTSPAPKSPTIISAPLSPTISPAPQSPTIIPAPQPPPTVPTLSGPTNITAILEKAGQFNIFIRLLKGTGIGDQINSALNKSQGLTLFGPPDGAFAKLPSGTINSYTDQQQIELVQFHLLPTYVPLKMFQTLSNPVLTQAGNNYGGQYQLNVTTSGQNVSMTSGIVNATVTSTIYTDGQLAVYQVDKVLLPLQFYVLPPPAPAPSKPKKSPLTSAPSISTVVPSNAVSISRYIGVSLPVAVVAVIAI